MYQVPPEHYLRLHFERSRFKKRLEDMLLLLANKIVSIGMMDKEQFDFELDGIIRETSEEELAEKTVRNQRTEMIRLFGLVKYSDGLAIPGTRLSALTQTQDTPRFFKSFCNKFQFPGGFLKPDKVSEMVLAGVKFKPAKILLRLLKIASSKYGEFAISAVEATHFIFNDKRIATGTEAPDKALERIMEVRNTGEGLDTTGDVIRYARDFLDYMVEANLLTEFRGMYAINEKESRSIKTIIANKDHFDKYSEVINPDGSWDTEEYKKVDAEWMEWFADVSDDDETLQTSADALVRDDANLPAQWRRIKEMLERRNPELRGTALKEIGEEGQKIAYSLEKEHIREIHPTMAHMVKEVDDVIGLGYDILSVKDEDQRRKKYIEVKTTKKNYESNILIPFNISINEWSVARQHGDDYFIYRVMITKEGVTIFSIQNPAKRNEEGALSIEPIAYKVVYSEKSGILLEI